MRFKAKVGIGGPKQRQAMQEMEASAVLSGADERLTLSIRLRPVGWEKGFNAPGARGVDIDIPAEYLPAIAPAIANLLSRYYR